MDLTSHLVADQNALFRWLSRGEAYGSNAPVKRIDTHGAAVFLAGEDAFKVKRAVRFPFMDFSTPERRRAACEAEVAINARNAPGIYLDVVPITRSNGCYALGGEGEIVDWAVHMRRFDESRTLDRIADGPGLDQELIAKLARAVLASHASAPVGDGAAALASLESYVNANRLAFLETPGLFPSERIDLLASVTEQALNAVRDLLVERGAAGYVRRCHGDLHLRNIVLIGDEPTLFDAIEFDDAIATGDVLYDLAFLLMDLWARGLRSEANRILNRYLWQSDDDNLSGLAALPLFLSLRAAIRAKVTASNLANLEGSERERASAEALRYFEFAESFLRTLAPRLVAIGGLSGAGKSTLAATLAPDLGHPPGAVHLRSDIERKRMLGVGETERLPREGYAANVSTQVFASIRRKAALALRAGASVIADAVHARIDERTPIEATARELGVDFEGIWLEAPLAILTARADARSGDASDAGAAVVKEQATYELGPIGWLRLDARRPLDELARQVLAEIGARSAG